MKISVGLKKTINVAISKAIYDWGAFLKVVEASHSVYPKMDDGEAREEFIAKRGFSEMLHVSAAQFVQRRVQTAIKSYRNVEKKAKV
jgi:DNA-binding transcriptional regulator GbsR (MarR family)